MHPLYLQNPEMKEFEANVKKSDKKFIILDNTAFYPNSGGQPHDTGYFIKDDEKYKVIYTKKFNGNISHEVDKEGLKIGDKIKCKIDWQRRSILMRMHTASHVLSSIIHKNTGALITGNQLNTDKSRIDFSFENLEKAESFQTSRKIKKFSEDFERDKIPDYIKISNQALSRNIEIKQYFLKKEDAMKIPGIVKLAKAMPPDLEELHIVEIGDIDLQADGAPHVSNTKKVGQIELIKLENKGKNNKRIYFKLKK